MPNDPKVVKDMKLAMRKNVDGRNKEQRAQDLLLLSSFLHLKLKGLQFLGPGKVEEARELLKDELKALGDIPVR